MSFKVDKSEILYQGKVFNLQVDEITYTESGNKGIRQVAVHPGGAVVVPVTDDGKIVLVQQFRYPLQRILLELPAGKLEPEEDPMLCATRELTEETGYTAAKVEPLGFIFTSPGFCTEKLYMYVATGLTPGEFNREEGEIGMEIHEHTIEEIEKMIVDGIIVDAKTIGGIYQFKLKYLKG